MKFPQPIPVTEIAKKIGATIIGNKELMAHGINEIHKVRPGDITFSDLKKYFKKSIESEATIIILNEITKCPEGKVLLICDEPFAAYDSIVRSYRTSIPLSVAVSDSAKIGEGTVLEPNVVVGHNVTIGKNCHIMANTVIYDNAIIGDNVVIEPNCSISTHAFYFKKYPEKYQRWRSGGRTIIENDVHIGSGTTMYWWQNHHRRQCGALWSGRNCSKSPHRKRSRHIGQVRCFQRLRRRKSIFWLPSARDEYEL